MQRPPYITDEYLDSLIGTALAEDIGTGDVTSRATVPPGKTVEGILRSKQDGVAAGLAVVSRVFGAVDSDIRIGWKVSDGSAVDAGRVIADVEGPARGILAGERLALNILQRMSGIATTTRQMVKAVAPYGTRILDTRKTAPGLRLLDKWAVLLGGGQNHRIGLFDMILVKENHIACSGSIEAAVDAARREAGAHRPPLDIEVEVTTIDEVRRALAAGGVHRLLLDNMVVRRSDGTIDTSLLRSAVDAVDGRVETEASGNVTPETVVEIARTGVDAISCGALTHSVRALDISLTLRLSD